MFTVKAIDEDYALKYNIIVNTVPEAGSSPSYAPLSQVYTQ